MSRPEASGLIVPLPEPTIDRIFHHRDTYIHPSPDPSKFLNTGSRVFFYDTLSNNLIGEAVVARLTLERWGNLARFENHLFLSAEELDEYAKEKGLNKDGPLLVLELEQAIKYMNPMKCPVSIPASGLRVTKQVFEEIARANR